METKYTPGPWHVDAMGNVWSANTKIVETSCQPEMAKGFYREKTDDEHRANARLIAAAPDLLDALGAFVDMYVQMINSGDCGNWNPEHDKEVIAARAAIAKATVEQQ